MQKRPQLNRYGLRQWALVATLRLGCATLVVLVGLVLVLALVRTGLP